MIKRYSSTNEVLMEMGKRIKRLRLASELTQADLSSRSGVSVGTIANLEKGKDISLSNLIAVFRALNVLEEMDALLQEAKSIPNIMMKNGKERQRVKERKAEHPIASWKWGDEE